MSFFPLIFFQKKISKKIKDFSDIFNIKDFKMLKIF